MSAEGLTVGTDRTGETVVVTLVGELAAGTTFRLEPELERLMRDTGARALVIDMSGVTFMDSGSLGMLLATQQRLRADGVRFLIANPSHAVRRILELTGAGTALSLTAWPPSS